jgi:hypothetical protein
MKYRVTAAYVQLHSGILVLSKEQARDRMHNLRKVKSGYEIVKPVQFKQGEEIGYDGELTHQLAEMLQAKPQDKDSDAAGDAGVQTSAQAE